MYIDIYVYAYVLGYMYMQINVHNYEYVSECTYVNIDHVIILISMFMGIRVRKLMHGYMSMSIGMCMCARKKLC